MNRNYVHICWVVLGVLLTFSTISRAGADEDKDSARAHFKTGLSLLNTGKYDAAAAEFEASTKLYPTKNGYFNLAVCYFELKRMNDAMVTLYELKKAFSSELDETWKNEISALEKKLINAVVPVEIRTNIANVTVKLDGKVVDDANSAGGTQYIDPGEHLVTLSAEGYETINETLSLKSGQGRTVLQFVMVKLAKRPSEKDAENAEALEQNTTHPVHFKNDGERGRPKKKRMIGTAIAFGIGGAAGAAAITTGVIHLANISEVHDICGGNYCEDTSLKGSVDKILRLGVATNVLISVAAVGIVAGTVLALIEGKSKRERRISVGPAIQGDGGGLVISGQF